MIKKEWMEKFSGYSRPDGFQTLVLEVFHNEDQNNDRRFVH